MLRLEMFAIKVFAEKRGEETFQFDHWHYETLTCQMVKA